MCDILLEFVGTLINLLSNATPMMLMLSNVTVGWSFLRDSITDLQSSPRQSSTAYIANILYSPR